jgi:hypothetical protein
VQSRRLPVIRRHHGKNGASGGAFVTFAPVEPQENGKAISEASTNWSQNDKEIERFEVGRTASDKPEGRVPTEVKKGFEPSVGGEKAWNDFLQFVFGKSKMLYTVLKDWRLKNLTEDLLEIENGNHKFSSGYFEEQEKRDQLTKYCRAFFQRDIRVNINTRPLATNSQNKSVESKNAKIRSAEPLELPSEVRNAAQNVLDLFEGKIINK